ncbi:zonular occludens toxin domain-containing protein [Paenibacillus sinopodophylli]|uniref:zonular occludens toxin domain-containing protein n=1 Tax=Paenibacillus sinopodophylli TaxID=1837342 RepID=UPI00110D0078|nr:zonular occludens toxin domain-containing protein [Paenibacillus sinopodophylli]
MITMYSGTIGSGKSYHALERIIDYLEKGKFVIANFPLNFTPGQIKRGWAKRFMYVDDIYFMSVHGIRLLMNVSAAEGWLESEEEDHCLLVIDEATNFFPKEDNSKPEQRLWRTFFTQSRKFGYDIIMILQDEHSINKTIGKCIEFDVKHRKANNIFPFTILNFFKITLFIYITYWKQQRTKLKSTSSVFLKRLSKMYQHKKLFANLDDELDKFIKMMPKADIPSATFGNMITQEEQLEEVEEHREESA